jgi:uncharacterized protein (DUF983 family)
MMEQQVFGASAVNDRSTLQAMTRGFLGRCPHCGQGKLFRAYLKVADRCEACSEEYHHHRADDLPAYLVVTIVGHIAVGAFMGIENMIDLSVWTHLAYLGPLTLILTLLALQPVKGAVVGLQWSFRMHGFSGTEDPLETHPELSKP